ncbi:MAG: DUF2071 domain-containing protein [Planctomycetota bacterium]
MQIPVIRGVIDRRILANFHIDSDVMTRMLPSPFRPKLVNDHAIGGICLIRLKAIRPRFMPIPWGIRSENAAHRIAVEWDVDGQRHEGVYIPRRDTDSRLNAWAGGTIFPGIHHHAVFTVKELGNHYSISMRSDDGQASVRVDGSVGEQLPSSSVFSSLGEASRFFENGSLGYSATHNDSRFDGLELRCQKWHVEPIEVDHVESSYFEDESQFPPGSVEFDCALLMRGVRHEWHGRNDLCCPVPVRGTERQRTGLGSGRPV